jgi:hypothetical protein
MPDTSRSLHFPTGTYLLEERLWHFSGITVNPDDLKDKIDSKFSRIIIKSRKEIGYEVKEKISRL